MMHATPPDVARLQPAPDALHVILKNTHFKDDILATDSKIHFRMDHSAPLPVLVFRFGEPYYDFLQILTPGILAQANLEWLTKNPVIVKLILSDTVVTDRLSTRSFALDPVESERLRANLRVLQTLPSSLISESEAYIYAHASKFLR